MVLTAEIMNHIVNASLFLIMFGVGTSVDFNQFGAILKKPKALILGTILQIVALPALAFIILSFFDLEPYIKVGIIIVAACPGGATSNFITYLAKANTALSIFMTSVNTLITLISIPFVVNIALKTFLGANSMTTISIGQSAGILFTIVVFPAVLGSLIRKFRYGFVIKASPYIKIITSLILATIFIVKIFATEGAGGSGLTVRIALIILPAVLLLHIGALFMGFFTAELFKLDFKKSLTVGIEVGLQNTALAFVVAGTILQSNIMTQPAVIYAAYSFWTTLFFALILKYVHYGKMEGVKDLFFKEE